MSKVIGQARNVRHSTNQVTVGSGNEKSIKTVHVVIFEVGHELLTMKQDNNPIPISDGDQITCVFSSGRPAAVLGYLNHSNGAEFRPSWVPQMFLSMVFVAVIVFTLVKPEYFFPRFRIPNTEIPFIWVIRLALLLFIAMFTYDSRKSWNIGNSLE
jgi:hypothetical protein